MNGETFDQIPVPVDVIGDYAPSTSRRTWR